MTGMAVLRLRDGSQGCSPITLSLFAGGINDGYSKEGSAKEGGGQEGSRQENCGKEGTGQEGCRKENCGKEGAGQEGCRKEGSGKKTRTEKGGSQTSSCARRTRWRQATNLNCDYAPNLRRLRACPGDGNVCFL